MTAGGNAASFGGSGSMATIRFGDFEVDVGRRELRRSGEIVRVEPKVFDLLTYLAEHSDRVVPKNELQDVLWANSIVTEASLTRCIMKARKAVGDDSGTQAIIRTVARSGYRFVADVDNTRPANAMPSVETGVRYELPERPSIAVMPFSYSGGGGDEGFLADGLTEDVITDLSRNGWLFVISRNSSFTYKGESFDVRQVGRDLGVRYVAEGSVRQAGNRLRVTVDLVDTTTGSQQWSERYDREIDDIFAVQDEICAGIVTALGTEVQRAEGRRARQTDARSLDAWGLIQRGMAESWAAFNRASCAQAETLYRRAVEIAPNDPRALAYLANNLAMQVTNGWRMDHDAVRQEASELCRRALDLAPDDPVVLGQLGHVHTCLGRARDGARILERARVLDPNSAYVLTVLSYAMTLSGRAAEAIAPAQLAMRHSPRDPTVHWALCMLSMAYLQLEDWDQARDHALSSLDHYSGWHPTWVMLSLAEGCAGREEEARQSLERAKEVEPMITKSGYRSFCNYLARDADQAERFSGILAKCWPE